MAVLYSTLILLALSLLCVNALPEREHYRSKLILPTYRPKPIPQIIHPTFNPKNPGKFIRVRRFVENNNPNSGRVIQPDQKNSGWEVKPDLSRDQRGNTRGQIGVENHGKNHDFEAGYGQVIRGPEKHSETWHVGGSIRW